MKKLIIVSITMVFFFGSCNDMTELNVNPNGIPEAHPQLLLTTIEWDAFNGEGNGQMYASRMVVQTDGESEGQYYIWQRAGFGYYNDLRIVTKMIEEAEKVESDAYLALGKFFRAYYFYLLTLTFGDVPYSEALKGESDGIYEPKYDAQKDVFTGILNELKEANDLLTGNTETIFGDIIYGGDPAQWRKLVNSFRLKVMMMLSKKAGEMGSMTSDFAAIVSGQPLMESNADNGQLVYLDLYGSQYFEFNDSGYGSGLYMDSTFIEKLRMRNDPRLFAYAGQTKNAKEAGLAIDDFDAYDGGNPVVHYDIGNSKAIAGDMSKVHLRYTTDPTCEPHVVMGYSELQLILAEANVRGWITSGSAKNYYDEGIRASFDFYNTWGKDLSDFYTPAAADAYLQEALVDYNGAASTEEQIELIITQMYLQSFLQNGWAMYFNKLRTGYPDFMLRSTSETPPLRWMYPNAETNQNGDNLQQALNSQYGGNDGIRETPWWLK